MHRFTVVGFYNDNDQPFVSWVVAEDPQVASTHAIARLARETYPDNLSVVEVFRGWVKGTLRNEKVLNVPPDGILTEAHWQ